MNMMQIRGRAFETLQVCHREEESPEQVRVSHHNNTVRLLERWYLKGKPSPLGDNVSTKVDQKVCDQEEIGPEAN